MRRHGTAAQGGTSEGLSSVHTCLIGLQAFEMQVRILSGRSCRGVMHIMPHRAVFQKELLPESLMTLQSRYAGRP